MTTVYIYQYAMLSNLIKNQGMEKCQKIDQSIYC